jgi:hypothetical protein
MLPPRRRYTIALFLGSVVLVSMAARAADTPTVGQEFDAYIAGIERDLVPLAEAMPADKFSFAPIGGQAKGQPTFAELVKGAARDVYLASAAVLGENPPVDIGGTEYGPAPLRSKEQVMQFLKGAFVYAHKAAQSLTAANQKDVVKSPWGIGQNQRGRLFSALARNSLGHQGWMELYLRMNGIVPPSAR